MLDPLSSLSLASNIISVVDFASKIVKGSIEIHGSTDGATVRNKEVEAIALSLQTITQNLPKSISSSSALRKTEDETALENLADKSKLLADELLGVLHDLKSSSSRKPWTNIQKAIAVVWNDKKIRDYARRLTDIQSSLVTWLVRMLSYVINLSLTDATVYCKDECPKQL